MRDKDATSHETPIDADDPEVVIVWLGDDKEPNLTRYFQGYLDEEPGWYWILGPLSPRGPFDTSKAAHDAFEAYIAEK